ncbi:MAG: phenylacetate--CoA ligase family protein, partial [Rhodospirillales bacterium]|nr:phenylacetate--CoA ligase family protein [Rhodospirillales bacterium]
MTIHSKPTQQDRRFWDAALETQSRAEWQAMSLNLLRRHLQHAYQGSPYYRRAFDAAGVHPDQVKSLDDLRRFPFIDKQVVRSRQEAEPP